MDKDRIKELLKRFNLGILNKEELSELEDLIEKGIVEINEIDSLNHIDQKIGAVRIPEPGEGLDRAFYQLLEKKKAGLNRTYLIKIQEFLKILDWNSMAGRLAYSILLVFIGLIIGLLLNSTGNRKQISQLSDEIQKMNQVLMISMLEKPSATERLKAVSLTNEMEDADNKVIEALLNTFNHDENVNVRLAALDALIKYSKYEKVRKGMVESIVNQNSELIQVTLADAMVKLQEKKSVENLKLLLKKEHLNDDVRIKINESIKKII